MKKRKHNLYGSEHVQDLKMVIALSRAINNHNRKALAVFRKYGLTTAQFAVLEALYHKGSMKVGEITEKILSTPGNMTVVIQNMERDGLVKCCQHLEDSRARLVSISDKGAAILQELFPNYLDVVKNVFLPLSSEEKQAVTHLLKKLNKREYSGGAL